MHCGQNQILYGCWNKFSFVDLIGGNHERSVNIKLLFSRAEGYIIDLKERCKREIPVILRIRDRSNI